MANRKNQSGNKKKQPKTGWLENTETRLSKRMNIIFWASLLMTLVFSVLLFDIRFSIAGDDSAYVVRAWEFAKSFAFPAFQGPLYPIFLSPFVALFGISALALKSVSLACMLGFLYFFYRACRDRIPALILAACLILLPLNAPMLYYASQTYSEAFFMFLQSVFLLFLFNHLADEDKVFSIRSSAAGSLLISAMILAMGLTRPIGFATAAVLPLYYLAERRWKDMLLFAASFVAVFLVFLGVKHLLWGSTGTLFASQAGSFLAKDYYDASAGSEDLQGFIRRFFSNAGYYLSNPLFTFLGFLPGDSLKSYSLPAILTAVVLLALPFMVIRRNRYVFFLSVYILISLSGIFLITQTMWLQGRYIISYFPLILLLLISFFYFLRFPGRPEIGPYLVPLILFILVFSFLKPMIKEVGKARAIKDQYSGLTPDWENYCRASEWMAKNLPSGSLVACRKASVSFIYSGGKPFFGLTKLLFSEPTPVARNWKEGRNSYTLIPMAEVQDKPLTPAMFDLFSRHVVCWAFNTRGNLNGVEFLLMEFSNEDRANAMAEMSKLSIRGRENYASMEAFLSDTSKTISVVYPDSLLASLRRAGVTHLLTDNFRVYATRKNQGIASTVGRYMEIIGFKYPQMFKKVMQIGSNDNEPAALFEMAPQ
jgi:hypothetical protein